MADHGHSSAPAVMGIEAHQATYKGFVNLAVLAVLVCLFIVVSLVDFRFVDGWVSLVAGFGGIILGIVTSVIGLRMGGKWLIPVAALVLYGLFIAANVHNS